jgi:hypothetical protein
MRGPYVMEKGEDTAESVPRYERSLRPGQRE